VVKLVVGGVPGLLMLLKGEGVEAFIVLLRAAAEYDTRFKSDVYGEPLRRTERTLAFIGSIILPSLSRVVIKLCVICQSR
jgi:hypothetical protein